MKNKFGLGLILGVIALIGIGAAQNKLIHDYPARVTLLNTDLFLVDTLSEYRSVSWLKMATAMTNIALSQASQSSSASLAYVNASTNTLGVGLTFDYKAYSDANTNALFTGMELFTANYISASTNTLALGLSQQTSEATNGIAIGLEAYTDNATNDLRTYVDGSTNLLGIGLKAYTDAAAMAVVPGVNNTVATNGNTFQVNVVGAGGSATNVVWPIAGANMTGSTNVLEVTLNADVSLASVAAKASLTQLQSATNVPTLAAMGITTNTYVQAATNDVLSTATTRITAATNTLFGDINTNGLGAGLRTYTDNATNGLFAQVNTNSLGTGLRAYTDAATNAVLGTATTRITSSTNLIYTASTTYATAATNVLLATVTTRINASTNAIAASTLTGTIALARLSGITSNQVDAATDAAYRSSGGDVTTAQLVDATNSTLAVSTARITAATNGVYTSSSNLTAQATNNLWSAVDARVVGATNGLWGMVNTNALGIGLRAYSDGFAVISGVNTTVLTNGHVFQVNAAGGGGGGSATNVVWPSAGANMTGSTNNLTVTLNADVSLASVAAKASVTQLQSATNVATLAAMGVTTNAYVQAATNVANLAANGITTNGYVQAATNNVLATATTRITAATNTLWAMVDTNGLGNGLRAFTGVATNSLWNQVNTNGLGNGLRAYTDNATNQVLGTATARITSATNTLSIGLKAYTDTATNVVLSTATTRINAATNGILNNPVFTGSLTVVGGSGTNDLYGINNITNVNGLRVSWKTNQILSPGPVTNTIIYLGF